MPEWLPTVSGWTLGILGGTLLAWALFGDGIRQRFKQGRRRRCPRCWYDMSHTPGLRCSECGHEVKRERSLNRGRRRWRLASVSIAVLLVANLANSAAAIHERGWVAAVPTTALILIVPRLHPPIEYGHEYFFLLNQNNVQTVSDSTLDKLTSTLAGELFEHRIKPEHEGCWASSIIALTCYKSPGGPYRWLTPSDRFKASITWKLAWAAR